MSNEGLRNEREETVRLFTRICVVAVILPLLSVMLVWLYFFFHHHELTRPEWKQTAFVTWLGTLLAIAREALRGRYRSPRRRPENAGSWVAPDEGPSGYEVMRKWETQKMERLIGRFVRTLVLLPLLSVFFTWGYFACQGLSLDRSDWKKTIVIVWIGTLIGLVRVYWSARKDRVRL